MTSSFTVELKKELMWVSIDNGGHTGNHRTVLPDFHSWWKSVGGSVPSKIKALFRESKFSQFHQRKLDDATFIFRQFVQPNLDLLRPVFQEYNSVSVISQTDLEHKATKFYEDILPIINNEQVSLVLTQQALLLSNRND